MYGLSSLMIYFIVSACDIREGNVTTRKEAQIEHICALGFSGYKRRDDIAKVDIAEMCISSFIFQQEPSKVQII
jgi:hypothetical protein